MKARVLWQSCVVAAIGWVGSGLALAQAPVDCSSVAEDMARLKCYDEQAARQKKMSAPSSTTAAAPATSTTTTAPTAAAAPATSATSTAPTAAAAPATAASHSTPAASPAPSRAANTSSDFGLNAEAIRKRQVAANPSAPEEPTQIVARVQAVATKPRGEYRITLDDGQVWEETQHSSSDLPPHVGETVTIKRGVLGSYFLSHSAGLALRVKRIN